MFNELENTLKLLLEEMQKQSLMQNLYFSNLTTRKQVAEFLGVCSKTIENYEKDGRFEDGVHYQRDEAGRLKYLPKGIVEFSTASKKEPKITVVKQVHPSVSKFASPGPTSTRPMIGTRPCMARPKLSKIR